VNELRPVLGVRLWQTIRYFAATAPCALLALPLLTSVTPAQTPPQVAAGIKAWEKAGCSECHSQFGVGGGMGGAANGPSLRRTRLDRNALTETIACGKPGTEMPSWLIGAYTKRACYNRPPGAVAADVQAVPVLEDAELQALVEYVVTRMVGKGDVTKAECEEFFGEPQRCTSYR
jgi:mono/diheme cytochrome c family protein